MFKREAMAMMNFSLSFQAARLQSDWMICPADTR